MANQIDQQGRFSFVNEYAKTETINEFSINDHVKNEMLTDVHTVYRVECISSDGGQSRNDRSHDACMEELIYFPPKNEVEKDWNDFYTDSMLSTDQCVFVRSNAIHSLGYDGCFQMNLSGMLSLASDSSGESPFEPRPIHPNIEYQYYNSNSKLNMKSQKEHKATSKNDGAIERTFFSVDSDEIYQQLKSYNCNNSHGINEDDDLLSYLCPSVEIGQDKEELEMDYAFEFADDFTPRCQQEDTHHIKISIDNDTTSPFPLTAESPNKTERADYGDALITPSTSTLKDSIHFKKEISRSLDHLKSNMKKSRNTQAVLQDWDSKQGLPKSHSWTMMHTNRSRTQIEENRVLPKWNKKPLVGGGSVKKRSKSVKQRRQ